MNIQKEEQKKKMEGELYAQAEIGLENFRQEHGAHRQVQNSNDPFCNSL